MDKASENMKEKQSSKSFPLAAECRKSGASALEDCPWAPCGQTASAGRDMRGERVCNTLGIRFICVVQILECCAGKPSNNQ